MNDDQLDALLRAPLPEIDAGPFSVALMERIARRQARPARILSWLMAALLSAVVAAACVFGARVMSLGAGGLVTIPLTLTLLTLVLSYAVLQSARE